MSAPEPNAQPRNSRRKDHRDDGGEDGTSTVELAILLPVYMLIFVAVMTIGHLVLIRQKVVEAVRYQAWLPNSGTAQADARVTSNFFGTYQPFAAGSGYSKTAGMNKTPYNFDDSQFSGLPGTQHQKDFALAVLNDRPTVGGGTAQHLYMITVSGKYSYQPDWMQAFHIGSLTEPKSSCTVLYRQTYTNGQPAAERKSMRAMESNLQPWEVANHNPIEDYRRVPGSRGFEISTETEQVPGSQAHDRFYTPGAKDNTIDENQFQMIMPGNIPANVGNPDPGLWNTGYRLGGDVGTERNIFRQLLGY